MEAPLLEIENATVWHGTTRVFERFNLKIGQHERVAILGPNGAGKTTLLKLINRELYPVASDDSCVRILGHERWNVWELREHIGVVSQDLQSGFMPNSTVLGAIVSGFYSSVGVHYQLRGQVTDEQVARARSVARELGLEALAEREFKTLSTGQQRRCLLGRALVHDPDTLILVITLQPLHDIDKDFLRSGRRVDLVSKLFCGEFEQLLQIQLQWGLD